MSVPYKSRGNYEMVEVSNPGVINTIDEETFGSTFDPQTEFDFTQSVQDQRHTESLRNAFNRLIEARYRVVTRP